MRPSAPWLPLPCCFVALGLTLGVFATLPCRAAVTNPANGSTYHVREDFSTWADAEAWAVSLGGHLATINSGAEDAWMHANLGIAMGYYWIGGRDLVEGSFEWVTGEPFAYQNFLPGEPDDDAGLGGNADCLALAALDWKWLDTNGDFVGFVNGAIAEVTATTDAGPRPDRSANLRLAAWPSVTRASTRLSFELARGANVRCRVFDSSGRCVRVLDAGVRAAGRHELAWDARDGEAREVRPGLYLVQVEAGAARANCKVVVAR